MEEGGDYLQDPEALMTIAGEHKLAVLDCCFSPEIENQLLTGNEDCYTRLWQLPDSDCELHDETLNNKHKIFCYRAKHNSPVTSVAMHRRVFLSASRDGQAKLWHLNLDSNSSGRSSHSNHQYNSSQKSNDSPVIPGPTTYNCHPRIIRSICFSPHGEYFATGSDDLSIKIWALCRNKKLVSLSGGHSNWINSVRWCKTNDSLLASCGDDYKICIWDARTKIITPPCITILAGRRMNCLDWHPVFGHHLATGSHDSACLIWDLRNVRDKKPTKPVQVYEEHNGSVNSVAFNPGGSLLLTGSDDKTSRIFDVCEGRNTFILKSHSGAVTSVCFNCTGDLIATGSVDKTVTIWRRNFDTVTIVQDDETGELYESGNEYAASDAGSSIPIEGLGRIRCKSPMHNLRVESFNWEC